MEYLFVYGTLMKKCPPNDWSDFLTKNADYVDEASIEGALFKIDYYPGLIKTKGIVYGEVFALFDKVNVLSLLDEYEDFNPADPSSSLYIRERAEITLLRTGKTLEAWVYYYNKPTAELEKYNSGIFISSE